MKRFKFSCSSIPFIYLCIWTICVILLFLYGIQTNTIWITEKIIPAAPQKLETPREHPMLERQQQRVREDAAAQQKAQQAQNAQAGNEGSGGILRALICRPGKVWAQIRKEPDSAA